VGVGVGVGVGVCACGCVSLCSKHIFVPPLDVGAGLLCWALKVVDVTLHKQSFTHLYEEG